MLGIQPPSGLGFGFGFSGFLTSIITKFFLCTTVMYTVDSQGPPNGFVSQVPI